MIRDYYLRRSLAVILSLLLHVLLGLTLADFTIPIPKQVVQKPQPTQVRVNFSYPQEEPNIQHVPKIVSTPQPAPKPKSVIAKSKRKVAKTRVRTAAKRKIAARAKRKAAAEARAKARKIAAAKAKRKAAAEARAKARRIAAAKAKREATAEARAKARRIEAAKAKRKAAAEARAKRIAAAKARREAIAEAKAKARRIEAARAKRKAAAEARARRIAAAKARREAAAEARARRIAAAKARREAAHNRANRSRLLATYKGRLSSRIRRFKYYPIPARRRGIQGRVRISFSVLEGGRISQLRLSGGHKQLQYAARLAVQKATPLPLPPGLKPPLRFSLTMNFNLR